MQICKHKLFSLTLTKERWPRTTNSPIKIRIHFPKIQDFTHYCIKRTVLICSWLLWSSTDPNQLAEERVYLTYRELRTGAWQGHGGRNWSRDHAGRHLTGFLPGLCATTIFYPAQAHLPRNDSTRSRLNSSVSINNQENGPQICPQANRLKSVPRGRFFLPRCARWWPGSPTTGSKVPWRNYLCLKQCVSKTSGRSQGVLKHFKRDFLKRRD